VRKKSSDRSRRTQVYPEEAELRRVRSSLARLGVYLRSERRRLAGDGRGLSARTRIQTTASDVGRSERR